MWDDPTQRLSDDELFAFFEKLFPSGVTGADVLAEVAPAGFESSPLVACFHPSVEQVFEETLQMHRRIEELANLRREKKPDEPQPDSRPEPTLEEIRASWQETPINAQEETTEIVGQCLWDVFSDNHEVIAEDGRVVDIGSFRGGAAFLDEFVSGRKEPENYLNFGNHMRFYMGTIWISRRADLSPVYEMIFGRIKKLGADWEYHFPELGIVDLGPLRETTGNPAEYSPSESFAKEQEEKERHEELERFRSQLAAGNQEARREALDRPPPATVRAYNEVFGHDPKGWPPA